MTWFENHTDALSKDLTDEEVLSTVERMAREQRKIDPGSFLAKIQQMVAAHEMEIKSLRRLIELMKNPEVEEAMDIWIGKR